MGSRWDHTDNQGVAQKQLLFLCSMFTTTFTTTLFLTWFECLAVWLAGLMNSRKTINTKDIPHLGNCSVPLYKVVVSKIIVFRLPYPPKNYYYACQYDVIHPIKSTVNRDLIQKDNFLCNFNKHQPSTWKILYYLLLFRFLK